MTGRASCRSPQNITTHPVNATQVDIQSFEMCLSKDPCILGVELDKKNIHISFRRFLPHEVICKAFIELKLHVSLSLCNLEGKLCTFVQNVVCLVLGLMPLI